MNDALKLGIDNMIKSSYIPPKESAILDYSKLSDIQKDIVTSDERNILVVAGAGSGKTRVLTERIKYLLLEKKVDPSSVVAITFTNMAADEMRERLMDVKGIGDTFIGTIHSFANRIFQSSGYNYTIYNDEKDNELHRYLINRYCKFLTFEKYLMYKDTKTKVEMGMLDEDALKEVLLPSEVAELQLLHRPATSAVTDSEYPETIQFLCRMQNIITFDELLKKATEYFKSLNAEIDYVLVDELQDVGSLEYGFIKSLKANHYFYVGDDWQSIYGFKGGNVNIFLSLIRDKRFKKYYLSDNYRCGAEILKRASEVISQVRIKVDKRVVCKSGKQGSVVIDSKYQIQNYLDMIKREGQYGDWFLLVRTNKEIFQMVDALRGLGIPCSMFKKSDMTLMELREEMTKNTVKVLTIHTAKGLESPNVLLVGRFPMKVPSYQNNPDERKVQYVGMTRAEDRLIILN